MTPLQALEMIYDDCEMDSGLMIKSGNSFEDLEKAFEVIRTALTPPTSDEVCEAIKKYLDTYDEYYIDYKVRYTVECNGASKSFELYYNDDTGEISETFCGLFNGMFDCDFSCGIEDMSLLVIIARFYEAQE